MRLSIDEYSKKFKMSKEMIGSKIRSKKLNYVVKDEILYIIVKDEGDEFISSSSYDTSEKKEPLMVTKKAVIKPKTTVTAVLALYQRENRQLKEKIVELEAKIDKLIDDKEEMLRYERDKIEELYSAKDEQLKNILELINTKLTLEQSSQIVHDTQALQSKEEIKEIPKKNNKIIELKEYLKNLEIKPHQRKLIKKRFLAVYDSDVRIIKQNGMLYLDFSKYDYSDLLNF